MYFFSVGIVVWHSHDLLWPVDKSAYLQKKAVCDLKIPLHTHHVDT